MTRAADLWDRYKAYTTDLTRFGRQLGFAAAAICWLLKSPDGRFPGLVLWALGAVVVYFFLDIVHALWAGVRVKRFLEADEAAYFAKHGKGMPSDHDVQQPRKLDAPIYLVYLAKITFLLVSFLLIAIEILRRNLT